MMASWSHSPPEREANLLSSEGRCALTCCSEEILASVDSSFAATTTQPNYLLRCWQEVKSKPHKIYFHKNNFLQLVHYKVWKEFLLENITINF